MRFLLFSLLVLMGTAVKAQDKKDVNPRPITPEEYDKTHGFTVKDLDNDTYVKIDNAYILDRYEMRKPYFITGDDGLKKRIDLYKLVAKDGLQELGLMIYYTNEKGKRYSVCLPNFTASGKVWEKYFEDIHAIDKEEKNFVLKLSYVLSKEVGFQLYKSLNSDKDLAAESATYGNDICFPGDQDVVLAGGVKKLIRDIQPGDQVIAVDPATKKSTTITVKKLVVHEAKNYAVTRLVLVHATEKENKNSKEVLLAHKLLEATPNHPMYTLDGVTKAGDLQPGNHLFYFDEKSGQEVLYTVMRKTNYAGGNQQVYNIEATSGSNFLINNIMVMQK